MSETTVGKYKCSQDASSIRLQTHRLLLRGKSPCVYVCERTCRCACMCV